MPETEHIGLTSHQVQNFIDDGFVKIENAFSTDLAKQGRDELWADYWSVARRTRKLDSTSYPGGGKGFAPLHRSRQHAASAQSLRSTRWREPLACAQRPRNLSDPLSLTEIPW